MVALLLADEDSQYSGSSASIVTAIVLAAASMPLTPLDQSPALEPQLVERGAAVLFRGCRFHRGADVQRLIGDHGLVASKSAMHEDLRN
jgi:hypothetical protein